jgi:hypothetical protein
LAALNRIGFQPMIFETIGWQAIVSSEAHSKEGISGNSSVASENLTDAQWHRGLGREILRYENEKNI